MEPRCGSRWAEEGSCQAAGKASLPFPSPTQSPPPQACAGGWTEHGQAWPVVLAGESFSSCLTLSTKCLLIVFLPPSSLPPSPLSVIYSFSPMSVFPLLPSPSFPSFSFPLFCSHFLSCYLFPLFPIRTPPVSCPLSLPKPSLPMMPHSPGVLLAAGGRAGSEDIQKRPGWKVTPDPSLPRSFLLPASGVRRGFGYLPTCDSSPSPMGTRDSCSLSSNYMLATCTALTFT